MLDSVDFSKVAALGFVVPIVSQDPAGYPGGLIYHSGEGKIKFYNGTQWVVLGAEGSPSYPIGIAGGDLAGSYPNPQIASNVIDDTNIVGFANIQQSKILNLTTDLGLKAPTARRIIAGPGLTGGGDLTADRTLSLNVSSLAGLYVDVAGDTMTGNLSMGGFKVTSLPDTGTYDALDAAPIWYVDQRASGLKPMLEVRLATTGPLAQLSGTPIIDGVQTAVGDRVLVRDQQNSKGTVDLSKATGNGIYIVGTGMWTRATDANAEGEISPGSVVAVTEGLTYEGLTMTAQIPSAEVPWVPGFSHNFWFILTSRVVLQAGAGLALTGNTLDVKNADGTLVLTPDDIRVASAPRWKTPITLGLTGDITGTTSLDGATNPTNIAAQIAPGVIVDADVSTTAAIQQSKILDLEQDLDGKVGIGRQIIAGNGLSSTGTTLAQDITLNVEVHPTLAITTDKLGVVSAPKWTTPINFNLVGDVTGTAVVDGTASINMATTVVGGSGGGGTVKHYVGDVAAGTEVVVTHGLDTRDVLVQVYRKAAPYDTVNCGVERTSATTATLRFASTTNTVAGTYRVVIQGS